MTDGADAPTQPKQEDIIGIIVKDQNGGEVMFKIKKHTKLSKVIEKYCEKKAVDKETIKFLHDGNRIKNDDTPETLGIEDGDSLDAVQHQIGGCYL